MKYIVREGKRRGRGYYLTCSTVAMFNGGFFHYSNRLGRAYRFDSEGEAKAAARGCIHIPEFRVVKLVKKPSL